MSTTVTFERQRPATSSATQATDEQPAAAEPAAG